MTEIQIVFALKLRVSVRRFGDSTGTLTIVLRLAAYLRIPLVSFPSAECPKNFSLHSKFLFLNCSLFWCFALLWEQLIANWTGGPTDRLSGCYGLPVKRVSAPRRAACDAPGQLQLHATTQTRKFKSCAHTECSQIWNSGTSVSGKS